MAELQQEFGMAMMLITHNLGVVAQMAEEVIVMYLGKVVERADVHTLFRDPKHPYTQELLKSIPRLSRTGQSERLAAISGNIPPPFVRPAGCSFHPRCPKFMSGVCDVVEPQLAAVGARHTVSCLLYSDVSGAAPRNLS
jgi:peptide/nickel transport system ATP-binding protein